MIDLISEGNAALWECVDKYDPTRGFKFISYAVWWIRQAMMHTLNENSRMLRLPRNKILQIHQLDKVSKQFKQDFDRAPSSEELANLVNIKEDKINQLFATNTKTISYDNTIGDDETGSLIDLIPNNNIENTDSSLDKESIKKQINTIINLLTDREHDIIKMYFGINCESLTLYEIANKFDLTHERARQLKNGAIDKLKTIYLHKIKKIINE